MIPENDLEFQNHIFEASYL